MICKNIAKYEPKDNKDIFDTLHELVSFIQFKNVKNTHRRVLFLRKLQASDYNFTKTITPPWVLFHVSKNCANGTKSRKPSHMF